MTALDRASAIAAKYVHDLRAAEALADDIAASRGAGAAGEWLADFEDGVGGFSIGPLAEPTRTNPSGGA